jgi:tRNA (guanine37-N1)-methyltransferase
MIIDVITLFPEMFEGVINTSMINIARQRGAVKINLINLRDFSTDKHKKVDAPPYGGGAGMVISPEPVALAVEAIKKSGRNDSKIILFTPSGIPYTQEMAYRLSKEKGLILVCGHYEGIDERVRILFQPMEISIGDYVLTGGEIPAMVVIDSVVRLLPGVLGSEESLKEESFTSGLLEYPHYTRPQEFRGLSVPDVLLSGNHKKIQRWRLEQAILRTKQRRPDLYEKYLRRQKDETH